MEVVIIGFPGVQRFIESGRTTADLWAASDVRSKMAAAAVRAIAGELGDAEQLVFPAGDIGSQEGVPNRLVVVARDGRGAELAAHATNAAQTFWEGLLDGLKVNARSDTWAKDRAPVISAIGCDSEYAAAWEAAQLALVAERRVRRFDGMYRSSPEGACRACGAAPAVTTPKHLQPLMRGGELLCPVCLVKRSHRKDERAMFPSTSTIAAAPFIADALGGRVPAAESALRSLGSCVKKLDGVVGSFRSVPGLRQLGAVDNDLDFDGAWCFAESWDAATLVRRGNEPVAEALSSGGDGLSAAKALASALASAVGRVPSPYLAVIAQDADRLGQYLSSPSADGSLVEFHKEVSKLLLDAALAQRTALEGAEVMGRIVYAGGDDLLALAPVKTAITAALRAQLEFRKNLGTVTASSAVVFFHRSYPLGAAIRRAREALDDAKSSGRNRVALVEIRRGGERASVMLPWEHAGTTVLSDVDKQVQAFREQLSSRLVASIDREANGLDELSSRERTLALRRVVGRHGGTGVDLDRVSRLLAVCGSSRSLVKLLTVTRFLAQEGR